MFSKRSLFALFSLLAGVTFTSWYSVNSTLEATVKPYQHVSILGQMEQGTIQQMSITGVPLYQVQVQQGTQYSNEKAIMHHIHATYYEQPNTIPWQAYSDMGHYNRKDNTLFLTGNVRLTREKTAAQPTLHFQTQKLTLLLAKKVAKTQSQVTFSEANSLNKTTASGMIANMNTGTVHLLHHVKSIYDPILFKNP